MASTSNNQQLPPCTCGKPITEEVAVNPDKPNSVTWSQKHTDFALVLKSGQELKCHKFVLAESSPFFDTMLSQQQFTETATSRMKVEHMEEVTVYSFLEYLYANKVDDEETIGHIQASQGDDLYIYKRSFSDKAKLTLDLMKVAHMYQVEDLLEDCAEYLTSTLCDHNVMERWLLAEKNQVEKLSLGATEVLLERASRIPISYVPGFVDSFDSNHRPFRDLLSVMSKQRWQAKALRDMALSKLKLCKTNLEARDKEVAELKGEVAELKGKLAEEKKNITVKVDKESRSRSGNRRLEWSELIDCKVTDTVQFLIDSLDADGVAGLAFGLHNPWLENNYTLEEYQIYSSTTLYAFYHDEM